VVKDFGSCALWKFLGNRELCFLYILYVICVELFETPKK